jgi:hypothetical protein
VSVYGLSRRPAPAANTIPIKVLPFVTPPQVRGSTARKAILPGMNDRLRGAGRRLGRLAPGSTRQEVADLRQRVTELEAEVQEARRLNRRVAELLDVVEELLVPLTLRDEEKVKAFLDAHSVAP